MIHTETKVKTVMKYFNILTFDFWVIFFFFTKMFVKYKKSNV